MELLNMVMKAENGQKKMIFGKPFTYSGGKWVSDKGGAGRDSRRSLGIIQPEKEKRDTSGPDWIYTPKKKEPGDKNTPYKPSAEREKIARTQTMDFLKKHPEVAEKMYREDTGRMFDKEDVPDLKSYMSYIKETLMNDADQGEIAKRIKRLHPEEERPKQRKNAKMPELEIRRYSPKK